jgi:hypothetical protein
VWLDRAGRCLKGIRHKGHNLSTGKTTLMLLFNTVLTGHSFPFNSDPADRMPFPPCLVCTPLTGLPPIAWTHLAHDIYVGSKLNARRSVRRLSDAGAVMAAVVACPFFIPGRRLNQVDVPPIVDGRR